MGVEPTEAVSTPSSGFEDRGAHRDTTTPKCAANLTRPIIFVNFSLKITRPCIFGMGMYVPIDATFFFG
jgi:hypothetical protein